MCLHLNHQSEAVIVLSNVNIGTELGQISTEGGGAQLEKQMSAIDLPSMRTLTFCILERKLGGLFEEVVTSELLAAGLEEKRTATEKNEYHNNVQFITVVVDAGWSKRSHKHSTTLILELELLLDLQPNIFCSLKLEISTVLFAQLLVVKERM